MRKLLIIIAVLMGVSPGMGQAAEVSVVNPSLTPQPPPLLRPATPALSSAFKQQPFPLAMPSTAPATTAPATSSPNNKHTAPGAPPRPAP